MDPNSGIPSFAQAPEEPLPGGPPQQQPPPPLSGQTQPPSVSFAGPPAASYGGPPTNPYPGASNNYPPSVAQSMSTNDFTQGVRIDETTNTYEHDEIWDSSPYLDASKSKRNRFGNFSMLSTRKVTRDRVAAVVLVVLVIFVVSMVAVTSPARNDKSYIALDQHQVYFPAVLEQQFATWTQVDDDNDVAFFWDVPLSGGNIVEDILGSCFKLVQASDVGDTKKNVHTEDALQIVEVYGDSYVNVDTTSVEGIRRAIRLGLTSASLADVIHSPYLREAGHMFQDPYKARLFTLIRHPIQRAVHLFHYLSEAKWDGYYQPALKDITLEQYAESNWVENNYMTRILVGKTGGQLDRKDVDLAKEILRRKCLVGLFDKMYESMYRFERYFGWRINSNTRSCQQRLLEQGMGKYEYPQIQIGSDAYILLLRQNKYDMELYNYAITLFDYQGTSMFAN